MILPQMTGFAASWEPWSRSWFDRAFHPEELDVRVAVDVANLDAAIKVHYLHNGGKPEHPVRPDGLDGVEIDGRGLEADADIRPRRDKVLPALSSTRAPWPLFGKYLPRYYPSQGSRMSRGMFTSGWWQPMVCLQKAFPTSDAPEATVRRQFGCPSPGIDSPDLTDRSWSIVTRSFFRELWGIEFFRSL